MPTPTIKEHWLSDARRALSPNRDDHPFPISEIDLLVIHGISLPPGDFSGDFIERFFLNRLVPEVHPYFRQISGLRVSAQYHCARQSWSR